MVVFGGNPAVGGDMYGMGGDREAVAGGKFFLGFVGRDFGCRKDTDGSDWCCCF